MATLFTKIIERELPAHVVAESDAYIAFLDIYPLRPGHTLVVAKREVDYFFHLSDVELGGMVSMAKRVALALERVVVCRRVALQVVGLEVPHAHIHLVPISAERDLCGRRPTEAAPVDSLRHMAAQVRRSIL